MSQLPDPNVKPVDAIAFARERHELGEAGTQLVEEMRTTLLMGLCDDPALTPTHRNQLLQAAESEFKIVAVTVRDTAGKLNVNLRVEMSDELHAYLSQPPAKLPTSLRSFLKGGTTIEEPKT